MKKLICMLMALILVLACTGMALAEGDKITLTIAYNDSSDRGENDYRYNWVMNTWNAWDKKDQVEVKIQAEPVQDGDFFTKMQLQLGDPSTAPDIILYDTFQLQADVAAGYFMKLDDYVAKWDKWNDGTIYAATTAGVTAADGSVYGIPSDTDTRGLWYNKAAMEKAGLGAEWQPTTWQEIVDAAKALKEAGVTVPMWMSSSAVEAEGTTMNSFLMFFYGTGERLVDDATGIWNINSQGFYDSLKFFHDLYAEGLGGEQYEVIDANASSTMTEYMMQDQCGIFLNGNWYPSTFMSTGTHPWEGYQDKIGFAKMPLQNGDGFITLSGGWALTLSASCPHPDEAFEFATMLMDPEIAYTDFIIARGDLATVSTMTEVEAYASTPFIALATSYLDFTAYRPANENYSTVSSYIYTAVEKVVTGSSVEDAMAYYDQAVTDLVGADFVKDCGCLTK
ncbi:MAG: extracellular solute-binding protein [Candidatus Faecivicinus sp.]|nr:extracellular solute-binding protein [Candidatus Faecivicinus sp.]